MKKAHRLGYRPRPYGILPAAQKTEASAISVPLRFDHYYPLDQVYEAVKALNKAYPVLTTLEEVGKSDEGRPIMAMTVNNPRPAPPVQAGHLRGRQYPRNEIQGGEITLYLLDYLLGQYGKNEEITALIDRTCFYVIPWSTWTAGIISSPIPTTPAPTAACASRRRRP